ncbi:MAG: SpoIIIAH-like family protein [Clostridiaceae bacterium]
MNKKQAVIIVSLLVLIVCAGVLATKVQSPLYLPTEDTTAKITDDNTTGSDAAVDNQSDSNASYFTEAKLSRNTQTDLTISNLKEMLNDKSLNSDSKKDVTDKLATLTLNANNQTKIEEELKLKGFKEVVCFIENSKAKVIVQSEEKLTEEQNKKIQSVVLNISQIRDVEITNQH